MEDSVLVLEARSGNSRARLLLWEKYQKLCAFALKSYRYNKEEHQSIAWEALCFAVGKYDPSKGSFAPYLCAWVRSRAAKVARRDTPLPVHESIEDFGEVDDRPIESADRSAKIKLVLEILSGKSEMFQSIVRSQLEGVEPVEVAKTLGISFQRVYEVNRELAQDVAAYKKRAKVSVTTTANKTCEMCGAVLNGRKTRFCGVGCKSRFHGMGRDWSKYAVKNKT